MPLRPRASLTVSGPLVAVALPTSMDANSSSAALSHQRSSAADGAPHARYGRTAIVCDGAGWPLASPCLCGSRPIGIRDAWPSSAARVGGTPAQTLVFVARQER